MSTEDNDYYPEQREAAWLAFDRNGTVGVFLTAGCGPIPECVFRHQGAPLSAIEKQLLQLPHASGTRLLVTVSDPEGYLRAARHGLFVYDWTDVHASSALKDAYELVAVPENSIQLDALPPDLQQAARAVAFPDISFAVTPLIDVLAFAPCRVSAYA